MDWKYRSGLIFYICLTTMSSLPNNQRDGYYLSKFWYKILKFCFSGQRFGITLNLNFEFL